MPTSELIYQTIKKQIFDNELKAGDQLLEVKLAEEFQVSRTPVREAIKQLEVEGLVYKEPNKPAVIKGISIEEAMEMYQVREVLEGLATRLTCDNISRRALIELSEILVSMKECILNNNQKDLFEYNKKWNSIILDFAKNNLLSDSMLMLHSSLSRLSHISMESKEAQMEVLNEYKNILSALENRDLEQAELSARQHVRNARKRFLSHLKKV